MTSRTNGPRPGFTLIEIMIVIAIIGVLVTLTVVGASSFRAAAQRTAATTEMAQISNAIGAFKAKFGVAYIPSFQPGTTNSFMLKASYSDSEPEAVYLKQLFPQMDLSNNGLRAGTSIALDSNQALVFFLTGGNCFDLPTDTSVTEQRNNYQGFSNNKSKPFLASRTDGEQRVGPFLEINPNKLDDATTDVGRYVDPWKTPYAYFSFDAKINKYAGGMFTTTTAAGLSSVSPYNAGGTPVKFYNPKGFQIISAGADTLFGPGGSGWTPGTGKYTAEAAGGDDVSNFNQGAMISQN